MLQLLDFWDNMVRFRENLDKEHSSPSLAMALKAVQYIRATLEPNFQLQKASIHPLVQRLQFSEYSNNLWLEQFARKLQAVKTLEGSESLLYRLGTPEEYLAARFEMEAGLALMLTGSHIEYVPAQPPDPTPDIIVKIKNTQYTVEVTSLNRSAQELKFIQFEGWVSAFCFRNGVTYGGILSAINISDKVISEMKLQIEAAVKEANTNRTVVTINRPGFATLSIAPRDLASQMPEGTSGMTSFNSPYERRFEEKITRAVEKKMKQIQQNDASFLVMFSDIGHFTDMESIFKEWLDRVGLTLGTFPQLMGVNLGTPLPMLETGMNLTTKTQDQKTIFVSEIGVHEPYAFLNWQNKYAMKRMPQEMLYAFQNYGEHLNGLPQLA
jgi:hypothetical protein